MNRINKALKVLAIATYTLLLLLAYVIGAPAQTEISDCIELIINGETAYESAACIEDTPTPTPEPTNTPTPEPIADIEPYPDAPACDSHDANAWHELWNYEDGCHYDHAHGMPEPGWAAELFGAGVADAIWTISYPWQTPDENLYKHQGYVNHAYDFRGDCYGNDRVPGSVNAYIAQTHGVAHGAGKLARDHSFALAVQLCNPGGDAGTIVTGGWEDYGALHAPYKQTFVSRPAFPDQLYALERPYIGENPGEPAVGNPKSKEIWNSTVTRDSAPYVNEHQVAGLAFRILDGSDYVDYSTRDTGNPVFIPYPDPKKNSSTYQLYQFAVTVPDLNGDGSPVTGQYYTDRHGNIVSGCTEAALDCVPLILDGAVPGFYEFNANQAGLFGFNDFSEYHDHDICFYPDGTTGDCADGDTVTSGWIDLSGFGGAGD